jgi:hypothetical protein
MSNTARLKLWTLAPLGQRPPSRARGSGSAGGTLAGPGGPRCKTLELGMAGATNREPTDTGTRPVGMQMDNRPGW